MRRFSTIIKFRLRLLQASIIGECISRGMWLALSLQAPIDILPGVVVLHMLLIPGTAFFIDGMRNKSPQSFEYLPTDLNHSILTAG